MPEGIGGAYLISPDGQTKKMVTDISIPGKLQEGWTVAPGQTVGTTSEYGGSDQRITGESYEANVNYGDERNMVPQSVMNAEGEAEIRRQEFEGRGAEAALAGVARGLTFGASDAILPGFGITDKETLAGLQEFEPGLSTAGELGSILIGGAGALGKGAIGAGLRATPMGAVSAKAAAYGAKGTKQFIAANAAEGALYGMGSKFSQIALSNEELASETAVTDILKEGGLAGLIGGGAGVAFKGAEKAYKAGKKFRNRGPSHLDIKTPEGAEYLGGSARQLQSTMDQADEMFVKTDPMASRRITQQEQNAFVQREQFVGGAIDDALKRSVQARSAASAPMIKLPVKPKGLDGLDDVTARLSVLDDELRAAKSIEAPDITPKTSGTVDDPASFDAMMRSRNAAEEGTSMLAGSNQRKISKLAKARREAFGKATGGVDEEALKAARTGVKGGSRATADIEEEIATLMAKVEEHPGLVSGRAKELVQYEKSLEAAQNAIALKTKNIADLDDAVDAVMRSRKYLGEAGAKVPLQGNVAKVTEDLTALRRLLGDAPDDLAAFADDTQKLINVGEDVTARLRAPIPEGTEVARKAYEGASKALRASVGEPTAQNLSKLMNASPEEMVKGFNALSKYGDAMVDVATISGDKALLKSTVSNLDALKVQMIDSLPDTAKGLAKDMDLPALLQAVGVGIVPVFDTDGPFDEIAKTTLMYALLRRGKGGASIAGKAGGKLSSTFTGKVAASGAAGSARSVMGSGGIVQAGVRNAAGSATYSVMGAFMNKLGGARGLQQLNGRAGSQIVHAINKLAKKGGRQLMTGKSAAAILKAANWADDGEKRADKEDASLQALFKKRTDQIRKMAHSQQALRQGLWESTKEMRELHPTWGDKNEVGLGNRISYAMEKMPRDPGEMHMFGKSAWQPNDFEIQEYANILAVIQDPMSAVAGISDGTLTPAAAEAFRATAPSMFEATQREIASRIPELQESLSHEEQNRIGLLMGVPVNVTTTPEYMQFIQQTHATRQAEQAESMGKVDANALTSDVPTQAQQLLNRGNNK